MTSQPHRDRLYDLLPAVHRLRDAERGEPLRALLAVISEQVKVVEDDLTQLYENWFIETAATWAVPYLADLVGYVPVTSDAALDDPTTDRGQARSAILVPRRDVANTIGQRRRRGTLGLLEQLATDVSGWPARAVELYRLLAWSQHVNHLRPARGRTVDVRGGEALERLGGPFDQHAHTVDVRRVGSHRTPGRFNIPTVAVFVWRLRSYPVTRTPAHLVEEANKQSFTFSVLGIDSPLFARPTPPTGGWARESELPGPISRRALAVRPDPEAPEQASPEYYGKGRSLAVWAPGWPGEHGPQPIPASQVVPADLSEWNRYRPRRNTVAVDPERGRIAFPPGQAPRRGVWVDYHYGFSADIGGGKYERSMPSPSPRSLARFRAADVVRPDAFASALATGADPLSRYLRDRWSQENRALLDAYVEGEPPSAELVGAMVEELNRALDDQRLYDEHRFPAIDESLRVLAESTPSGSRLARVNRLLLEAGYPTVMAVGYLLVRVGDPAADPRPTPLGPHAYVRTIEAALRRWTEVQPRQAVIELAGDRVFVEPVEVDLGPGQGLYLRAENRTRSVIRLLDWQTDRPDFLTARLSPGSRLTLDGLLVTGRGVRLIGVRGERPDRDGGDPVPDDYGGDGGDGGDGGGGEQAPATPRPTSVAECSPPPSVVIRHSTLVPGWSLSSDCEPRRPTEASIDLVNLDGRLRVEHSIVGSIQVQQDEVTTDPVRIDVADSVLDATAPHRDAVAASGGGIAHAVLTIVRSTVIGVITTHAIDLGENSVFDGLTRVARRQRGCLRFSFVVPGSRTPRRHACQPDLAEEQAEEELRERAAADGLAPPPDSEVALVRRLERERVKPLFTSSRYGHPGYCQLALVCAEEIRMGADDQSEMGVFHDLYQPQRAANLEVRLEDATPAGMEAGIVYVT
ncbi:MAG TPA: hypothetical protein VM287_08250 [Egibacteraceae bacterium]|nr:hypothetical protein [Egibacteraceae bacterium]